MEGTLDGLDWPLCPCCSPLKPAHYGLMTITSIHYLYRRVFGKALLLLSGLKGGDSLPGPSPCLPHPSILLSHHVFSLS